MKTLKASELIAFLQEQIKEHGDLPVCTSKADDYWGSIQNGLTTDSIYVMGAAKLDGPKSFNTVAAIVFPAE